MKTTTINWHNVATDGLPEKSGNYLVIVKYSGMIADLSYSAKHQKFNAYDCEEKPDCELPCEWWAEKPELGEEVGNDD